MNLFEKIFGTHSQRELKLIQPKLDKILSLQSTMAAMSEEELKGQTEKFKNRLAQGDTLDDLLPEAFATVREAAKRELGMEHFPVQLIGGIVLHQGRIAEMRTGEGKTLVSTCPAYLNALAGNGVHVVTVNEYLAKRDSEWMGPLYMFPGLSVDCIDKHQPNTPARRAAYDADITFGTNNEFGFDYLRDNMATSPEDLVQRKHNYAIVDEVDSVLIDDARTPLIISGPVPKGDDQLFEQFLPNVETVVAAQHKLCQQLLIDAKKKIASEDKKEQEEGFFLLFRAYKGMPKSKPLIKYLSEPGIKTGMLKVEEEYMADNMRQMHIVTEELYFVIDEKHNSIELSDKGIDLLTRGTDDPTFFILPDIASQLAELSGPSRASVCTPGTSSSRPIPSSRRTTSMSSSTTRYSSWTNRRGVSWTDDATRMGSIRLSKPRSVSR